MRGRSHFFFSTALPCITPPFISIKQKFAGRKKAAPHISPSVRCQLIKPQPPRGHRGLSQSSGSAPIYVRGTLNCLVERCGETRERRGSHIAGDLAASETFRRLECLLSRSPPAADVPPLITLMATFRMAELPAAGPLCALQTTPANASPLWREVVRPHSLPPPVRGVAHCSGMRCWRKNACAAACNPNRQ